MRENAKYKGFSPHLFWDMDIDQFDINMHKTQLIYKVVEYGLLSDWYKMMHQYGKKEVKHIVMNLRTLSPVTLAFLSSYFQVDKRDFRCYKEKQQVKNYWNS